MADAKIGKMDKGQCGVWLRAVTVRTSNKEGASIKKFPSSQTENRQVASESGVNELAKGEGTRGLQWRLIVKKEMIVRRGEIRMGSGRLV